MIRLSIRGLLTSLWTRVTLAILMVAIPALAVMGTMSYRQAERAGLRQMDATLAAQARSTPGRLIRNWARLQLARSSVVPDEFESEEASRFPSVLYRRSSGEVLYKIGALSDRDVDQMLAEIPEQGTIDQIQLADGRIMRRTVPELPTHKIPKRMRHPPQRMRNGREVRDPRHQPRSSLITRELLEDIGVVVLTDTSAHDEALADLRGRILALTLVTISACMLAGGLAGGAISRPLKRLAEQMKQLDPQRLDEPLQVKAPVHEVRQLVEIIETTRQGLAEAFSRERRLTADIAHELRSPLAVLQAELASLPQDTNSAQEAGRQLQFIIDALLTLSRIESGNAKVRPQMIDVMDIVDSSWRGLDQAARAQQMRVQKRVDPMLELATDPVHLGMALRNLFDNAVSHGDPQGEVIITADTYAAGIRFTVQNTCIGALPELVDRMFDPCWRDDSSTIGSGHLHSGLGCTLVTR